MVEGEPAFKGKPSVADERIVKPEPTITKSTARSKPSKEGRGATRADVFEYRGSRWQIEETYGTAGPVVARNVGGDVADVKVVFDSPEHFRAETKIGIAKEVVNEGGERALRRRHGLPPPARPLSLSEIIMEGGGISIKEASNLDGAGIIRGLNNQMARAGRPRGNGLFTQDGMRLDDVRQMVVDEGYVRDDQLASMTPDDVLQIVRNDVDAIASKNSDGRVYTDNERAFVDELSDYHAAKEAALQQAGTTANRGMLSKIRKSQLQARRSAKENRQQEIDAARHVFEEGATRRQE